VEAALEAVRNGENPELSTRQKHTRECFVVLEEGADAAKVEEEIKTMPNYFSDYDTTVHFISQEELDKNHSGIPHGGFVLRSGKRSEEHTSELQSRFDLVCRLLLEKKNKIFNRGAEIRVYDRKYIVSK